MILGQYLVAGPASLELWLLQDRPVSAIFLLVFQVLIQYTLPIHTLNLHSLLYIMLRFYNLLYLSLGFAKNSSFIFNDHKRCNFY